MAVFAPLALTLGLMAIGLHVAQQGGEALNEWVRGGTLAEIQSTGTSNRVLFRSWRLYLLRAFFFAGGPLLLALLPASLVSAGPAVSATAVLLGLSLTTGAILVYERRASETSSTLDQKPSKPAQPVEPPVVPGALGYRENLPVISSTL